MEKAQKAYKVSYKTYYNDRIKEVLFHTTRMYPLYIQVIFDRYPIIFKSYYFDLFSKPKYGIRITGQLYTPDIKVIIKKEENLLEFIINKNYESFSLDLLKKEYAFYSRNLLDLMEDSFLDYLYTFLHDEGLPFLADIAKKGASDCKMYDLVHDLRRCLNSTLYKRLIDNSYYLAPPYLLLFNFILQPKSTPFTILSVMEWEQPGTKESFIDFFKKYSPEYDVTVALDNIQKWVNQ